MVESSKHHALTGGEASDIRVLVVDDDPSINRLLQVRLRARGFQVETAFNGEEALLALGTDPPDLILCDVSMPGASGLDVLAWIRTEELDLAVIMTTAYGSEQVAVDALRRGADDYLRKPFDPSEFHVVIDRTLSRLLLGRQNAELRHQLDRQRQQLEAELDRASDVQAALLPQSAPRIPNYDIAAVCRPARQVGGDFYDWQLLAGTELSISIGDVMGKGMPAAILMATVRTAFRAATDRVSALETMLAVERALNEDLGNANNFVTAVHVRLDFVRHSVSYVDAGHGYGFLCRANGAVEHLAERGFPLGIGADIASPLARHQTTLTLDPGDALVMHSDGVVDAPMAEGLDIPALAASLLAAGPASEMVSALADRVGGGLTLPDDLTIVVVRRLTEPRRHTIDPPRSPT